MFAESSREDENSNLKLFDLYGVSFCVCDVIIIYTDLTMFSNILSLHFCNITKLSDIVVNLLKLKPEPSLLPFLNDAVIATEHDVAFIPEKFSLASFFSLEDVLHHSIEYLLDHKHSNILCFGYTIIREGYKRFCISGSNRVQIKAPNTTVMYLKTKPWNQLHSLVGDDVMLHIFQKTFLFVNVGNNSFVQLCGKPLNDKGTKKCNCKAAKNHSVIERPSRPQKRRLAAQMRPRKRRKLATTSNARTTDPPLSFSKAPRDEDPEGKNKTKKMKEAIPPIYLHRSKIFYSKILAESFPKRYILSRTPSSNSGAHEILNVIFEFTKDAGKNKRLPKHLIHTKPLVKTIISNFRTLKLRRLLNFYCPLPKWSCSVWGRRLRSKGELSKVHYKFAVRSFVPVQQVYRFVRKVMLKVFPSLLWGSKKNEKKILGTISHFLSLGRYERVTVQNIMFGIKTVHFKCFQRNMETGSSKHLQFSLKQQKCVETLIQWLFNHFIVPLVKGCFYVTETGVHKNKVFYYRKPIWRIIRRAGLQPLLGNLFQTIKKRDVDQKLKSNSCIGLHDIRLLPAQKKIRAICNMTKCLDSVQNLQNVQRPISINAEMRALHLVLSYEFHQNSKLLGVGVTSPEQIYQRWKDFVYNCKMKHSCIPKLYFISLDIKRCFDTLPQDRILNLVPDVLTEDQYIIKKFVKIKMGTNGSVCKKYVSKATDGYDCSNFVTFIRDGLSNGRIVGQNTVFVDKVYYRKQSRDELLSLLKKHVKNSIGHVGDRYLIQTTGIAQGSILANSLNNLHYGDIESKHLVSPYQSTNSFFLRWVDDYLFVTTSQQLATNFLNVMQYNMPRYGCHLNLDKTLVNFKFSSHGQKLNRIKGDWFPWCGYFFNVLTMEGCHNFIQYIGENIRDGMTFQFGNQPGRSMARQLTLAVCVKAVPLVCDTNVNSISSVYKNIYQVFRFVALKFVAHAKWLTKGQGINIRFCYRLIKRLPLKFCKRLHRNFLKTSSIESYPSTSASTIKLMTVKVLCFQAFVDVLRPKQSNHGRLIKLLVGDLKRMKSCSCDIDFNEIREHAEYFKLIKI